MRTISAKMGCTVDTSKYLQAIISLSCRQNIETLSSCLLLIADNYPLSFSNCPNDGGLTDKKRCCTRDAAPIESKNTFSLKLVHSTTLSMSFSLKASPWTTCRNDGVALRKRKDNSASKKCEFSFFSILYHL